MTDALIEAASRLKEAICDDPFAILGPHVVGGTCEVRAFLPGAQTVSLCDHKGEHLATAAEVAPGFFVAVQCAGVSESDYQLCVNWPGGRSTFDDAYRFGLVLGDLDMHLLVEGNHKNLDEVLGAIPTQMDGVSGVRFAVWAPNAKRVSIIGDFNSWDGRRLPMRLRHACGVWELFVPHLQEGALYKFEVLGKDGRLLPQKSDPLGRESEVRPATASRVVDGERVKEVREAALQSDLSEATAGWPGSSYSEPMCIYEVHLGSWRRVVEEGNRFLSYDELADTLIPYAVEMGFTHLELLPIAEHPFDGSWGYQPVGLYAPTSRFGSPISFAKFVHRAHQSGLGVILDWVPGHFPTDPHGLGEFDGTHLYEHADPRLGLHPDWDTYIYNFGRREVQNFLIANALFWLRRFRVDALRVDAVASMLYLDYGRPDGQWLANRYGGRENLEAVEFLKRFNEEVFTACPKATTIAEESTAWPGVSKPTYEGGLGFGYKWNMGWMHDTLEYMKLNPVHRRWSHSLMTFAMVYAYSEHFVLPLSHDEVVHGKGSLLNKMPGDHWQQFANLRAYLGFMYGHPGRKLLFMGAELAQRREWNHDQSLDWDVLGQPDHRGVQNLVKDLNLFYRDTRALHAHDDDPKGFLWAVFDDALQSVFAFVRFGDDGEAVLVLSNLTPVPRFNYRIGVPYSGCWRERINTDAACYGGSNLGNWGGVESESVPSHGQSQSLRITLPPLATLFLVLQH